MQNLSDGENLSVTCTPCHMRGYPETTHQRQVVLVGVILLPIMKDAPEAHRCLALLLQVSIWWTFESVPIYVTAIYVPLPVVVGHILLDANGAPMPASAAATQIAYQFMDPVVFLFLGGFTIAAALGKYRINQVRGRDACDALLMVDGWWVRRYGCALHAPVPPLERYTIGV